jgi:hypothetical protein
MSPQWDTLQKLISSGPTAVDTLADISLLALLTGGGAVVKK